MTTHIYLHFLSVFSYKIRAALDLCTEDLSITNILLYIQYPSLVSSLLFANHSQIKSNMNLLKLEDFFDQKSKCLREYFKLIIVLKNAHRKLTKFLCDF